MTVTLGAGPTRSPGPAKCPCTVNCRWVDGEGALGGGGDTDTELVEAGVSGGAAGLVWVHTSDTGAWGTVTGGAAGGAGTTLAAGGLLAGAGLAVATAALSLAAVCD